MDNSKHTEELIEKYISGEMSAEDLRSFENEMNKDLQLKEEVQFQQDIVSALRMERRAVLKARLEAIKVPSPYASYYTAGIASVVLISGIVLLSSLWPIDFNSETPIATNETEITDNEVDTNEGFEKNTLNELVETNQPELEVSDNSKAEISAVEPEVRSEKETLDEKPVKEQIESPKPNIVIPEAPDPNVEKEISTSDLDESAAELVNNDIRETSKVDVEIKISDSYNFHYQYFNNKLFLYGDFSKSPYELIELNADQSKNLYMYFGGKYYSLKTNQIDVTRLTPLRDKIITKGLDNLRLR